MLLANGVGGTDGKITKEEMEDVKRIDDWFYNNKSIVKFNEFKYFGVTDFVYLYRGFANCSNLVEIELPDTLVNSHHNGGGTGLFSGCTSLKKLDFNNLTSLCQNGMSGCTNLKEVIFRKPTFFGPGCFYGTTNIEKVFISSVEMWFRCTTYGWNNDKPTYGGKASLYIIGTEIPLTSLTIPTSITKINAYSLYNLKSITAISYSGTITDWLALPKGTSWHYNVGGDTPVTYITCTDGRAGLDDTTETGNTYA